MVTYVTDNFRAQSHTPAQHLQRMHILTGTLGWEGYVK